MASPQPPPGYFDPDTLKPIAAAPPSGWTEKQEPSMWGRWTGTQAGPLVPSRDPEQFSVLPARLRHRMNRALVPRPALMCLGEP